MTTKHGMRYKNFILRCDPVPAADGRFAAQASVANEDGAALVERLSPALGHFASEAEAIDHAREWGKKWADDHELRG